MSLHQADEKFQQLDALLFSVTSNRKLAVEIQEKFRCLFERGARQASPLPSFSLSAS